MPSPHLVQALQGRDPAALHHLLPLAGALARRHVTDVEAALGAFGREREEARLLREREGADDSVIALFARAHEDDAAAGAGELGHLVERGGGHLPAPGGDPDRRGGGRPDRGGLGAPAAAPPPPPPTRRPRAPRRGARAAPGRRAA